MIDPNHPPAERRTARQARSPLHPAAPLGLFAVIALAILVAIDPALLSYAGAALAGALSVRLTA